MHNELHNETSTVAVTKLWQNSTETDRPVIERGSVVTPIDKVHNDGEETTTTTTNFVCMLAANANTASPAKLTSV